MKEERFFYVPDAARASELPEAEAQHATRVLRLSEGDEIFLMDGEGVFYKAVISLASNHHCFYGIEQTLPRRKTWTGGIRLAIAPTKMMERMEWLAEKATEIGFDRLSFVDCKFSERHVVKTERIEKIVVSAMKQSRKPFKPVVDEMMPLIDFMASDKSDYKFIAHCYNDKERVDFFDSLRPLPPDASVSILVGPEGDFSVNEVELAVNAGYRPVTLGLSRLRTETAGLMAVAMAQIAKRLDN